VRDLVVDALTKLPAALEAWDDMRRLCAALTSFRGYSNKAMCRREERRKRLRREATRSDEDLLEAALLEPLLARQ